MLFNTAKILLLSILVTTAYTSPVPSSQIPRSPTSIAAIQDDLANGVLTAGDIVEAVAQGLGTDSKAGGIVQTVADGLKAGGKKGN
ncbi:hypothetical protein BKA65DRAFT_549474 [Rhexocercosporidium sp. MPI-PUGE-AT-0058]|nr:hypothetical protein BKA65DRAFT_549474 [Rhexocercosporidium sp. MPI-PUGE-AT-0058]